MKSMKKKLLSAVATLSALAPITKSFAAVYDDADIVSSSDEASIRQSKDYELIKESIESMKSLTGVALMKPVITVKENGDVFISKSKWRWGGPGGDKQKIGKDFNIDREEFTRWLRYDHSAAMEAWYSQYDTLLMRGLKKWTNNSNAKIHKNFENLKKRGIFDECIRKYIEEISGPELENAQKQIEKQKAKFQGYAENSRENEME